MGWLSRLRNTKAAASNSDTASRAQVRGGPRRRAVGGAGTGIWAGSIYDTDPNTDVRGDRWYGRPDQIGIAGQMLRDPHVRQSVNAVSAPLRAATWVFRPADASPLAREIADFCQWAFIEALPWDRIVRRVVNGYTANGFALEEMTDDTRPVPTSRFPLHPGSGAGLVPTAFYDRPAWTLHAWEQSRKTPTQIAAAVQYIQGSDAEEPRFQRINANRLLRWTYDQEGADFDGLAVLRSAYGAWKSKYSLMTILMIALERTGVGTPVLVEGEGAQESDREQAEQALAEWRAHEKAYLILPFGWSITWEGGGESDAANLIAAIEMQDKSIAFNVGAGFTLLGLQGKSGSYALGSTLESHYHLTTEGQASFFTNVWNFGSDDWSPIQRIVSHNYGPGAPMPRLEARNLPTKDWEATLKLASMLKQNGLLTYDEPTEGRFRDILQVDPLDKLTARETTQAEAPDVSAETTPVTTEADDPGPRDDDEEEGDEE